MSLLYADTSALIRAYFADEPQHDFFRVMLLEGTEPVVTSEIARLELASAVRSAAAGGRLSRWRQLLARMDEDTGERGPVQLIALRPEAILPAAYQLILEHRLRTLDALHLAVALEDTPAIADGLEIVFITRDDDQSKAAGNLGFALR
jgi:predicted nucleic acid-binding protein